MFAAHSRGQNCQPGRDLAENGGAAIQSMRMRIGRKGIRAAGVEVPRICAAQHFWHESMTHVIPFGECPSDIAMDCPTPSA
jgi:hypothetical protein